MARCGDRAVDIGLVAFGEVGDLFDPSIHEAVMHDESEAVDAPTATSVLRVGYLHKDRLLRPAMVGVSDPTAASAVAEPTDQAPTGDISDASSATAENVAAGDPSDPRESEDR